MRRSEVVSRLVEERNAKTAIRINQPRARVRPWRMSRKQIVGILFLLLFLMGNGIGYVWSSYGKTQVGIDLSGLKKEEMRLQGINEKLKLELALLMSPRHLESVAVKQLGLKPPSLEQIVCIP